MPTNVSIPALGESVSEAVLLKWHKQDGERVNADEPLCELETEKANVDVPSPASGVLKHSAAEGTKVKIGDTIGTIIEGNGAAAAKAPPAAGPAHASTGSAQSTKPPARTPPPREEPDDLSPAVRRMIEENKIDPKSLTGTGPGGRILKEDVIR